MLLPQFRDAAGGSWRCSGPFLLLAGRELGVSSKDMFPGVTHYESDSENSFFSVLQIWARTC